MILLTDYGYSSNEESPAGCIPARICAVHRGVYRLICEHGEISAKLKAGVYYQGAFQEGYGSELYPTVGDFVWISYQPGGDSLITGTLPRRSLFSRRAAHIDRGEQSVAANFDYVFILMSLNQNFNLKRLERYLAASWQSGGTPVVVLTKADLAETDEAALQTREAGRVAPGVDVFAVSAHTGEGLDRLEPYLVPGKTIVFLGSSGVGKSSLINALAGEEVMRVSEIRQEDARGRHTTTHRQLLRLASGVLVIDSPGMRELGMWDAGEGVETAFADVEELFARCRFTDCTHGKEPGCAVREALADGRLDPGRWENYLNLRREAQFTERKEFLRQNRLKKAHGGKKKARDKSAPEEA